MENLKNEERLKIFFITGELSAEAHTAKVVVELLSDDPSINIRAMGSNILQQFGADVVFDYKNYSFSGVTEVVFNIVKILKLKRKIVNEIIEFEPDVLVLVDYAGLNLEVAKALNEEFQKRDGTDKAFKKPKIIEYIAPQLWASRPYRIKKIKENIDKVLCTLPFEEEIYRKESVPVRYVGNPVRNALNPAMKKRDFLKEYSNITAKPELIQKEKREFLIGVFPGSRKSEIKKMLPVMTEAAASLKARANEMNAPYTFRFILAKAPNLDLKVFKENGLDESVIELLDPKDMMNANHKLLSASDMLWLCSGTVTLEAALYKVPYFLTYKTNWINIQLYRLFRIITRVGLANIIADQDIVKEFIQEDATVENFINETEAWINPDGEFSDYYQKIKSGFDEVLNIIKEYDTPKIVASEIMKASQS